jgi:hypothetical protein
LENNIAKKYGFQIEKNFSSGTLISGDNLEELSKIEAEGYRVKNYPDTNILNIGLSSIDSEKEELPDLPSELKIPESLIDTWTHYIVHCKSPPTASMIQEIQEEEDIDVVEVMSQRAIFIVGKPEDVKKIPNFSFVEKVLPFQPAYRIDKKLLNLKGNIQDVLIAIYPPKDLESVKEAIYQVNGKIISTNLPKENEGGYAKLIIQVNSEHIPVLACLPSVRRLEYRAPKPVLDGERETQILARNLSNMIPTPGYQSWLSEINLSGEDIAIAICDSGIDVNANNNTEGHPDIRGRQIAFVDYTNGVDKSDTHGHGTHVAGICVGNGGTGLMEGSPPDDFLWGQGIAPQSKYINVNFLSDENKNTEDDYGKLIKNVANSGADIMNNSWGSPDADPSYNDDAKTIDGFCVDPSRSSSNKDLIIVFSAGNLGPDKRTLSSPHAAKNPIIVGNSLTFRHPDYDNFRGVYAGSSRGPTNDGRIKPDIVAPGTYVSSAWSKTGNAEKWGYNFVPGTENMYMFGTGTSMAAPHVSGCCALLIEWWRKRTNGKDPSLSMLKAILINSAEDLAPGPSGRLDASSKPVPLKHIPSTDQGWGLVTLNRIFKKMPNNTVEDMIFSDQRKPFTAPFQEHSITVTPVDKTQELRITLAWTDPPGEIGSNQNALVNDLDLEVMETSTGKIYKGNVFDEGYSTTGGDFDNKNNVECVYIKVPKELYEIRIIASKSLAANARPPFNKVPWQPYALVIYNAKIADNSSNDIELD